MVPPGTIANPDAYSTYYVQGINPGTDTLTVTVTDNSGTHNLSLPITVVDSEALMDTRKAWYLHSDLNVAQGAAPNPLLIGTTNGVPFDDNTDATTIAGYPAGAHSALFVGTTGALAAWYSQFVIADL